MRNGELALVLLPLPLFFYSNEELIMPPPLLPSRSTEVSEALSKMVRLSLFVPLFSSPSIRRVKTHLFSSLFLSLLPSLSSPLLSPDQLRKRYENNGAFATYAVAHSDMLFRVPENQKMEKCAALPFSTLTAYQVSLFLFLSFAVPSRGRRRSRSLFFLFHPSLPSSSRPSTSRTGLTRSRITNPSSSAEEEP